MLLGLFGLCDAFRFPVWNWVQPRCSWAMWCTFLGAVLLVCPPSFKLAIGIRLPSHSTPLLADAFFCVFRRLLAGQRVFQAHRLHLFQRPYQAGWPHARVSLTYIVATALLALGMLSGGLSLRSVWQSLSFAWDLAWSTIRCLSQWHLNRMGTFLARKVWLACLLCSGGFCWLALMHFCCLWRYGWVFAALGILFTQTLLLLGVGCYRPFFWLVCLCMHLRGNEGTYSLCGQCCFHCLAGRNGP